MNCRLGAIRIAALCVCGVTLCASVNYTDKIVGVDQKGFMIRSVLLHTAFIKVSHDPRGDLEALRKAAIDKCSDDAKKRSWYGLIDDAQGLLGEEKSKLAKRAAEFLKNTSDTAPEDMKGFIKSATGDTVDLKKVLEAFGKVEQGMVFDGMEKFTCQGIVGAYTSKFIRAVKSRAKAPFSIENVSGFALATLTFILLTMFAQSIFPESLVDHVSSVVGFTTGWLCGVGKESALLGIASEVVRNTTARILGR